MDGRFHARPRRQAAPARATAPEGGPVNGVAETAIG